VNPKDFDLLVIGAGSGGVRAARMAAQFGARVAICEDRLFGGTCVNLGCIPKKFFVYASQFREECEVASGYGWELSQPEFRFDQFQEKKDKELKRLQGIYRGLMTKASVTILDGKGVLLGPNTVEVDGQEYTAAHILVATGGEPTVPDIEGAELGMVSDDIFALKTLPQRMAIVGGGYIAVELAGVLQLLGVHIDLFYRGPLFLRGFDSDLRIALREEMTKKGIHLYFDSNIESVVEKGNALALHLSDGQTHETDQLLFATGRRPRLEGLGLDNVGVKKNADGFIEVDAHFKTSVPSIFAVGDVIGGAQLTPVALQEGTSVAHRLFADKSAPTRSALIPTAVFSQPPLASVGLTEEEARTQYPQIRVYHALFTPLKYTLCENKEKACVKVIVDDETDVVVGCHMMGESAPEIIQGLAVALTCGATKAQFDATLGIHPTSAEEFVTLREARAHA
jgi:glutathione reductase (NADPH)